MHFNIDHLKTGTKTIHFVQINGAQINEYCQCELFISINFLFNITLSVSGDGAVVQFE